MSNSQSRYRTENSESHDPTLRSCALEFAPITHLFGDWSFPMNVISFVTTHQQIASFINGAMGEPCHD